MKNEEIYIENQPILTKIFNKISNSGNSTQGYLLVGESSKEIRNYSLILSKILICPNKYTSECHECNICKRIDDANFPELEIIFPENGVIKKERIINLRNIFNTESIEGKNGVYIINDVESLNSASANAILKFLEEPDSNVVAVFNTTNLNAVIPTIASRCQIIKINNIRTSYGVDFVKELTNLEEDEIYSVVSFVKKIEFNKALAFAELKNDFIKKFDSKEKLNSAMLVMLLLYKDILNYKVKGKNFYFEVNELKKMAEENKNDIISRKISFILENMEKIEYNVNVVLFMSNLLIGIGDITNGKSNRN